MGSISAANAEFCFDVFKEVKFHHPNDNIFYCPLSMIAALAMVYLGARNNTEYQMKKVSDINGYKLYLIPFKEAADCPFLSSKPAYQKNGFPNSGATFHLLHFPMKCKNSPRFSLRKSSSGGWVRQVSCFSLYYLRDLIPSRWKGQLETYKR